MERLQKGASGVASKFPGPVGREAEKPRAGAATPDGGAGEGTPAFQIFLRDTGEHLSRKLQTCQ